MPQLNKKLQFKLLQVVQVPESWFKVIDKADLSDPL